MGLQISELRCNSGFWHLQQMRAEDGQANPLWRTARENRMAEHQGSLSPLLHGSLEFVAALLDFREVPLRITATTGDSAK